MSKVDDKGDKKFTGVAIVDFVVGTKSPKKYSKGDPFTTVNEAVYNSLITSKKIK